MKNVVLEKIDIRPVWLQPQVIVNIELCCFANGIAAWVKKGLTHTKVALVTIWISERIRGIGGTDHSPSGSPYVPAHPKTKDIALLTASWR